MSPHVRENLKNLPSSISEEYFVNVVLEAVRILEDRGDFDNATGVVAGALAAYNGSHEGRRMGLATIAALQLKAATYEVQLRQAEIAQVFQALGISEEEKQQVKEVMEVALGLRADGMSELRYSGV